MTKSLMRPKGMKMQKGGIIDNTKMNLEFKDERKGRKGSKNKQANNRIKKAPFRKFSKPWEL